MRLVAFLSASRATVGRRIIPRTEAELQENRAYTGKGRSESSGSEAGGGPLLAVLDLGTNNCRLLIARPAPPDSFRVVDSFSRIVRLGEGVGETGLLSEAAIDRTIAALKICAQRIARHRVRHVRAIATQAARQAGNTAKLIARARQEAGIELHVISPEDEADLAALGCAPLIGRKYKGALIFDIGGGSTEIVWQHKTARGLEKRFAASLPVGVVNLAEDYADAARNRAGFETMRAAMRERFAPFAEQTQGFDPAGEHLLGTSGTVTTLAAIALKLPRYIRAKVDGSWHETPKLLSVVDRISRMDVPALAGVGAIGPERADLMLAGSAIFTAICALWPSAMLRVADRGLREGMLRQLRDELASRRRKLHA
ncbi:MAG TPA: Ppx/GppA phosphatase family protein [Rhizomicrobium sp.]|jgi:exopolyphosphatase/guanosine-5'-triphosphate,3'-diphosphate pyrophosphatase